MQIIIEALEYATEHHKSMFRKETKIPYMSHLLNVCKLLAERDCEEPVLAAALLHDIVEDTGVTIKEVETKFGKEIASLVAAATEPYKLDKLEFNETETWRERKEHTIQFIKEKASLNQALIILADKTDNISSIASDYKRIGPKIWERFNAKEPEQRWYFYSLLAAFTSARHNSKAYDELVEVFEKKVNKVFIQPIATHEI